MSLKDMDIAKIRGHRSLSKDHREMIRLVNEEGMTQTDAYLTLHPNVTKGTASVNASKMLNSPSVRNALEFSARKKGITEDRIIDAVLRLEDNPSWKAQDAFIDRATQVLGHDMKRTPKGDVNVSGNVNIQVVSYVKDDDDGSTD